jgi:hypothetical protein
VNKNPAGICLKKWNVSSKLSATKNGWKSANVATRKTSRIDARGKKISTRLRLVMLNECNAHAQK